MARSLMPIDDRRIIIAYSGDQGRQDIRRELANARLVEGHSCTLLSRFDKQHLAYVSAKGVPQLFFVAHTPKQIDARQAAGVIKARNIHSVVFAIWPDVSIKRDSSDIDEVLTLTEFIPLLRPIVYAFNDHRARAELVQIAVDARNVVA